MSRIIGEKRGEGTTRYWAAPAAAMAEGLANVLVRKEFGQPVGAINAAIQIFDLALKGYPLVLMHRCEVYVMVKDLIARCFAIGTDDGTILLIVRWKNILDASKIVGFNNLREFQEDFEKMKSFFMTLAEKGDQDRSNHWHQKQREADDDE